MKQRNLFTFFLISMAVLFGWQTFMGWMWPPKPRPPQPAVVRLPYPPLWASLAAATPATPTAGLADACRVAAEIGTLANRTAAERPPVAVAEKPEPPKPPVIRKPNEQVAIGNEKFNLRGTLTTRGAGVESLTLTAFEEADRLGLMAKPVRPLELLPDDPQQPSHLLLHYRNPTESRPEHPEAELGELEWDLKSQRTGADDETHEAVFTCAVPNQDVVLTKTYTLARGDYHLGLTLRMERKGSGPKVPFRYQLTGGHAVGGVDFQPCNRLASVEGEWYTTVFRNALIGWSDNKGAAWRDLQVAQSIGLQDGGREVSRGADKFLRFAGVATQYFASMIVVDDQQEKGVRWQDIVDWARPTTTVGLEKFPPGTREQILRTEKSFLVDFTVRLIARAVDLEADKPIVHKYLLYNGPVKVRLLGHLRGDRAVAAAVVDRYLDALQLRALTDYPTYTALSWWSDLIIACTNIMHGLLYYLNNYVAWWSYGVSIILLTVVVRGFLFPLSRRQAAASVQMQEKMQRLNQELAPEIKKLEEKFKNDPWQLRQAKHELYAKAGVNPMAMLSSCWLMFAQLPIFLGLYYALQESINFRLQRFLWMPNLAAPDMLIWWGERIPFVSDPANLGSFLYLGPFFNLLPIVWVALMLIQQKLMTPPPADEQQAMQQKMMKYMMIPFFFFFYKVPSGLCIYWIGSILWSLSERKLLPKKKPAATTGAATESRKGANGMVTPRRGKAEKAAARPANGAMSKVSDWWAEVLKQARKK